MLALSDPTREGGKEIKKNVRFKYQERWKLKRVRKKTRRDRKELRAVKEERKPIRDAVRKMQAEEIRRFVQRQWKQQGSQLGGGGRGPLMVPSSGFTRSKRKAV